MVDGNYSLLQSYLQMPVSDEKQLAVLPHAATTYCILFHINQNGGLAGKLLSCFSLRYRIWRGVCIARKKGYEVTDRLSVYPNTNNPVAVYQQGTAADYALLHVLPAYPKGISGVIRKCCAAIAGCHASVAAIGLIIRDK